MHDQQRANELIALANEHAESGGIDDALPLYRQAGEIFAPYASMEIVSADKLYELGRLEEAAEVYRRVVAAVPDHDQAWESLARTLYQLGRRDEADIAMMRYNEIEAELSPVDAASAVAAYGAATTLDEKARLAEQMLHSVDHGAAAALHDFLASSRRHRVTAEHDYAPLQASILVRFGMAEYVYWYSDGPAPDRRAIEADITTYLSRHQHPPDAQRPIWTSPPPDYINRRKRHPGFSQRIGARILRSRVRRRKRHPPPG